MRFPRSTVDNGMGNKVRTIPSLASPRFELRPGSRAEERVRARGRANSHAHTMEHCLRGKCRRRGMQIRPWNWETIGLKLDEYVGSSWIALEERTGVASNVFFSFSFSRDETWEPTARGNVKRLGNILKNRERNCAMILKCNEIQEENEGMKVTWETYVTWSKIKF